jgi:hypothetical protein
MFLHGDTLPVEKRKAAIGADDRIALTVSPYVKSMAQIIASHHRHYPNLRYIPQDVETLGTLLFGEAAKDRGKTSEIPIYTSHPLFLEDKVRMFVDPWTWIDYLTGFDFNFGTRIHGTIASLLAGTPGYLFAHDSRTLELARYFEIPHRVMRDVPADVDAAQLYDEADYSGMINGHKARFETMLAFLAKHDLDNAFAYADAPAAFDAQVRATTFRPAVRPALATSPETLVQRIQWLRDREAKIRKQAPTKTQTVRKEEFRARIKKAVPAPVRRMLNR